MNQLTPLAGPRPDQFPDDQGTHQRVHARANIFVMAALSSGRASGPVRVRNMSSGGALVEGAVIPPAGVRVGLTRGSLSVAGEVVWQLGNKAGIKFDSTVSVPDWLPRGSRTSGQQRVDEIVFGCKAGLTTAIDQTAAPPPQGSSTDVVAKELRRLGQALNATAEMLADDPAVSNDHINSLQVIDVTAHKLEALARLLASTNPPAHARQDSGE